MSALTITLPLIGTLAAAGIGASVALYVKRLERWNAAEARHSEAREKGYEAYLAACDRAWHLRIKASVDEYRHRAAEIAPEDRERIVQSIERQAINALEELKRHSRDFEKAGILLLRLHDVAFMSRRVQPVSFEAARVAVQDLQRQEAGLRKKLGTVRKASIWEERRYRRESQRILRDVKTYHAIGEDGEVDEIIHQGDGEAIWHLLQENMREWEEIEKSVALQEARSARWKEMGLWPE